MFMNEPEPLDTLLREWKAPEPAAGLDQRVAAAYRSAVRRPAPWKQFWKMRISIPAPVLVAAALVLFALFFWLRPAVAPVTSPEPSGVVTRLNALGFEPLPDGQARVLPVSELQK
jgi:hypothetical protein